MARHGLRQKQTVTREVDVWLFGGRNEGLLQHLLLGRSEFQQLGLGLLGLFLFVRQNLLFWLRCYLLLWSGLLLLRGCLLLRSGLPHSRLLGLRSRFL